MPYSEQNFAKLIITKEAKGLKVKSLRAQLEFKVSKYYTDNLIPTLGANNGEKLLVFIACLVLFPLTTHTTLKVMR